MANKQDFCHLVEADEEVVRLLILSFVPFQQINLKINVILGLMLRRLTIFIGHLLSFFYVLDIKSDSSGQLKERLSHAGGDVVDDVAANQQVDQRADDQRGHPKAGHGRV